MDEGKPVCPKCLGTGRVKEKNGTIRVCYDCLLKGEMDQHDKNLKVPSGMRFKI